MPKTNDLPAMEGPGVGLKKIKEVEEASDAYVAVRDRRMKLTEEEVAARTFLSDKMKKHGLDIYRYDDHEVVVKHEDKVKVRTVGDNDEVND